MSQLKQLQTSLGWKFVPGRMIDRNRPRPDPELESIYRNRGLILVHIPKNAGTSVEDAIFGYRVRHRTWREIREACPHAWSSLPKIAIVRDPVDRFLSAFDYLKSGGRNEADRRFARRMIGDWSLEVLLNELVENARFRRDAMRYFHFQTQSDFVCDGDTVMVDTLIPFHDLVEGLHRVAGVDPQDLAHANKTKGKRTQKNAVSQSAIDDIRQIYASDVTLFEDASAAWTAASNEKD